MLDFDQFPFSVLQFKSLHEATELQTKWIYQTITTKLVISDNHLLKNYVKFNSVKVHEPSENPLHSRIWRERLRSLSVRRPLDLHFNRFSCYNRDVDENNIWKQSRHPPVSMEFPPSPIIYSEAIFQENNQPACKSVSKKIIFKTWWNTRISSPQISGGYIFLLGLNNNFKLVVAC